MSWKTFETRVEGKNAIVLLDERFANSAPVAELTLLTWIAVWRRMEPDVGYWNEAESASLDRLEDELIRILDDVGQGWAVYVLRIATPGIREYYCYSSDVLDVAVVLRRIQRVSPDYRIEGKTRDDRDWSLYRRFVALGSDQTREGATCVGTRRSAPPTWIAVPRPEAASIRVSRSELRP